ncbi:hypothetical protein IFM89_028653 [Coptis chinensis]|uniref:adenosylmethionine decarboxylase n=1 Tax=Coptis chinensis TaxID=261450 RepID=A0A835GZS0_9MAGN|nr:hypothetical protein IFM89_028653 [Coptis chinensis]
MNLLALFESFGATHPSVEKDLIDFSNDSLEWESLCRERTPEALLDESGRPNLYIAKQSGVPIDGNWEPILDPNPEDNFKAAQFPNDTQLDGETYYNPNAWRMPSDREHDNAYNVVDDDNDSDVDDHAQVRASGQIEKVVVVVEMHQGHSNQEVGPAIGFEGFEKRLQISFFEPGLFADAQRRGLRSLSNTQLDEILNPAECTIVASLSNADLDSYVLSESSLFVFSYKIIIKTCGTTKLLLSIPHILRLANTLSLSVKAVKYTPGSFVFPGAQSYPHRSFSEEVSVLDGYFGNLGVGSRAYMMGSITRSQNWHVYSSCAESMDHPETLYTLEMCMTGLDKNLASVSYKTQSSSAAQMTNASGIRTILPQSENNDFEFDPCGYSMNAIEGSAISTIHVTPEDGFSYASFEAAGYDPKSVSLEELIERVLACFGPTEFSIAVHAEDANDKFQWDCRDVHDS